MADPKQRVFDDESGLLHQIGLQREESKKKKKKKQHGNDSLASMGSSHQDDDATAASGKKHHHKKKKGHHDEEKSHDGDDDDATTTSGKKHHHKKKKKGHHDDQEGEEKSHDGDDDNNDDDDATTATAKKHHKKKKGHHDDQEGEEKSHDGNDDDDDATMATAKKHHKKKKAHHDDLEGEEKSHDGNDDDDATTATAKKHHKKKKAHHDDLEGEEKSHDGNDDDDATTATAKKHHKKKKAGEEKSHDDDDDDDATTATARKHHKKKKGHHDDLEGEEKSHDGDDDDDATTASGKKHHKKKKKGHHDEDDDDDATTASGKKHHHKKKKKEEEETKPIAEEEHHYHHKYESLFSHLHEDAKGNVLGPNPHPVSRVDLERQHMLDAMAVLEAESSEEEEPTEKEHRRMFGAMATAALGGPDKTYTPTPDRAHDNGHVSDMNRNINLYDDCELPSRRTKKSIDEDDGHVLRKSITRPTAYVPMAPNEPHPALESPLLYRFLRPFPALSRCAASVYRMRWHVSYPLQRRVPCGLFRTLRISLTWGEALLLLPFFAALAAGSLYTLVFPSVKITGHTSSIPMVFAFVTAAHNSLPTLLLGIPFERAIWYHKLSAGVACINAILHTYTAMEHDNGVEEQSLPTDGFFLSDEVNASGTLIVAFMALLVVTSLPWVRHRLFEVFYFFHLLSAIAMGVAAFFHTGFLVPLLVGVILALDFLIRRVIMPACLHPKKATLRVISDTVVELVLPKAPGFDYNPGQYVFLAVPELTIFQWHPFSLSSSPFQNVVTLHIRKAGAWTTALYELAKKNNNGTEVTVLLEGPYGSLGVNLLDPKRYKIIVLFGGGIGVTPMQSICNYLMHEYGMDQRYLLRLTLVWIERDPIPLRKRPEEHQKKSTKEKKVADARTAASRVMSNSAFSVLSRYLDHGRYPQDIATTILSAVPASYTTDKEVERAYPSVKDILHQEKHHDVGEVFSVFRGRQETFRDEDDLVEWGARARDGPLDLRVHLSTKRTSHYDDKGELLEGIEEFPFVRFGRPDVKKLFHEIHEEAIMFDERQVAVCVCAPKHLVKLCEAACIQYSKGNVRFDMHHEVFE